MTAHCVSLLLKSYRDDLEYVRRLIDSFHQHNVEGLHLYCVVPEVDIHLFKKLDAATIQIVPETVLGQYLTATPVADTRPGYINQEVIKMSFWELGFAENYFCVDSEAVFLRDFDRSDFIAPDGFPYTILVEDNELKTDPTYYTQYWNGREEALRKIASEIDLELDILQTCHGHQIFSSTVLRDFKENFLEHRSWSYLDALALAPYEFTWYNFWLQKSQVIPIHQREPLVKVFHSDKQHLEYILSGATPSDLSRGYLAALVNSNFSRARGPVDLSESKPEALSHYLSYGELLHLIGAKLKSSLLRSTRPTAR